MSDNNNEVSGFGPAGKADEEVFISEPKTEYISSPEIKDVEVPAPAPVVPEPVMSEPVDVPEAPEIPSAPEVQAFSTPAPAAVAPAAAPFEPSPVAAPVAAASAATAAAVAKDSKKQAKREAKIKKQSDKMLKEQAMKDECPNVYKPVSTSRYFWLIFLLSIPVIGFIATIILAIAHRNRNVKAFVRAVLAWEVVIILLALIGLLIATFCGYGDLIGKIALAFGEFFETLASAVNL